MKNNNYKLLIFGENYSIVSDESSATVTKAANLIDSLMKEIVAKATHIDEKRVAVLVALQMASKVLVLEAELAQIRLKHTQMNEDLERELKEFVRS